MAGKSRVGSLYYEIVLDPSKFKKGGKQVTKDFRRMQKTLAEANKNADPRAVLDERLKEEKAAIKRSLKAKKIGWDEAKKLQKAAISNHEFAMKKIEKNERMSLKRRHVRAKKAREAEVNAAHAIANKMVAEEAQEHRRLERKHKAYLKHRHDVQRRWNRRKVANEKEAARKVAAVQKSAFAGGMFGTGGIAQGFGSLAAGASELTSDLFPLALIGYGVARALSALGRAMWSVIKAADEKKKQMIVLTTLMDGNADAATRLRGELVEYAKATAFSVKETTDLAISMKALGFQAEEIPKVMAKLGRLSFGDGGKLKLIAKAYSDVKAQGKLLMTEVRQFANQGVPLLAQLQLNLGLTALETRDMMKKGLIGFQEVEKAISDISSSYGSVDTAGLKTLTGQLDAAREAWGELMAKFGQSESIVVFGRLLNGAIESLDQWVDRLGTLNTILTNMPGKLGALINLLNYLMVIDDERLKKSEEALALMEKDNNARLKKADQEQKMLEKQLTMKEEMLKIENQIKDAGERAADAINGTDAMGEIEARREEEAADLKLLEDAVAAKNKALMDHNKVRDQYSLAAHQAEADRIAEDFDNQREQLKDHLEWQRQEEANARSRKAQADREAAAKKAKDEADAAKAAAKKIADDKRKMHLDDIKKAANKFRDDAQDNIKDFDRDKAEREKLRGMSPANAPSFSAGSVEEHQFLKQRESQKEERRFELKMEAERKAFIEQQNKELADNIAAAIAATPLTLSGEESEDVFEAVE